MATTFLVTTRGLELEAESVDPSNPALNISHIELGTGQYNPVGDETALNTPFSPRIVYPISARSAADNRLTIRALIADAANFTAYEMGIYANGTFDADGNITSNGELYALAAHTSTDGVLLTKASADIVVFQGGINYSNQPNFTEGPTLLAPLSN